MKTMWKILYYIMVVDMYKALSNYNDDCMQNSENMEPYMNKDISVFYIHVLALN